MKIAGGTIVVTIEGRGFSLRPALRRAIALQSGYRGCSGTGLSALARDIGEGSLTASLAVIGPFIDRPDLAEILLRDGLNKHQAQLMAFTLACAGIDPEEKRDTEAKAKAEPKTQTYDEYLAGLYKIGTGWLGWTPEVTLDATIAEITEAFAGKLDMLKAVYGGGESKTKEEPSGPWDRNVRSLFAGRTVTVEAPQEVDHVG